METLTKDFFISELRGLEERLESRFDLKLSKQGEEFQRYIGIIAEDFQGKLSAVAEMVIQNSEDITEIKFILVNKSDKSDIYALDNRIFGLDQKIEDVRWGLDHKIDTLREDLVEAGVI